MPNISFDLKNINKIKAGIGRYSFELVKHLILNHDNNYYLYIY